MNIQGGGGCRGMRHGESIATYLLISLTISGKKLKLDNFCGIG